MGTAIFPKAGSICPSCLDFHKDAGKDPQRLVNIGTTRNKRMIVAACPYCDGDRIIGISVAAKQKGKKIKEVDEQPEDS